MVDGPLARPPGMWNLRAMRTPTTLGALLSDLAARHDQRLAVACGERELTFAQLDAAADRWAVALRRNGIGPGKHVGLLAANGVDWPAAAFGTWRAGAALVPISTFVAARELEELLHHADVDLLITQSRLRSHDYFGMIDKVDTSRVGRIVVLGEIAGRHTPSQTFLGAAGDGAVQADVPEAIACILYTSGTTGRPKGVRLSHRAILATVAPTALRSGLTADDSMLSTLPLFWVAGLVIRALPTWATGSAMLFVDAFTPEAILSTLSARRPTALHLRPPQVTEILRHPGFRPALLATVRRGNGRAEWFEGHLPPEARFITGYGMTEMAGYVTALHWSDSEEARRNQMGSVLPGVEVRIVDENGRECPAGITGAIRVRGPGLFSGYHKEPPDLGLDAHGWFVTGDLGSIDGNGTFHFAGRSKDLLRVKGINVSPLEVESVLAQHPDVNAAYVVGLPHDGLEQRVVALIVSRGDPAGVETELAEMARVQLSHYKRPDAYIFLNTNEVPLGATSKPQRRQLAEMAEKRLA
jgi:fatty-acyl-CoA synthase